MDRIDKVRIAHLSDLHCNGENEWLSNFNYVIDLLREMCPNLIVITGDSVENPSTKNYNTLKEAISRIKNDLNKSYILTIPGNHDYSFLGNKFFNFKRDYFKREIKHLLHPKNSVCEITDSFFKKFKIALFPLDSNAYHKVFFLKLLTKKNRNISQALICFMERIFFMLKKQISWSKREPLEFDMRQMRFH